MCCCAAGEMNGKALQKFVLEAFPSFVTRVTSGTMQQFMGPDIGSPRVFLFTDKEETPTVYAALSVNLRKYKYKFADVHSSDGELMKQFSIKKVSTLHSPRPVPCDQVKPEQMLLYVKIATLNHSGRQSGTIINDNVILDGGNISECS